MLTQRNRNLTRFLESQARDDASAADAELLERFARQREESAFVALVKRHGAVVQQVCRRMHLDEHATEDVFQSTFLVLAKRADDLTIRKSLGAFLHGTAYRIAAKALQVESRRRENENAAAGRRPEGKDADVAGNLSFHEAKSLVDCELAELDDKYRIPIILRYLEGKSQEEASRQLRLPRQTVGDRIDRGLEILRRRLTKRGYEMSAVMLLVTLGKADASIPASLAVATAKSATLFVQGTAAPSSATLLASSTLTGLARLDSSARLAATLKLWLGKGALVLITGAALTLTGVRWWEASRKAMPQPNAGDARPAVPARMQEQRVEVRGRVVDQTGRPLPRAAVALLASRRDRGERGRHDDLLCRGKADAAGQFVLEVPADFPYWVPERGQAKLLATAPGLASGITVVTLVPGMPAAEVRLHPPERLRGRLVDRDNHPAAGVAVRVVGLGPVAREAVEGKDFAERVQLPGWPQAAVTNEDGRFELAALDPRHRLALEVQDDRFARLRTVVEQAKRDTELTIKLSPPQWLEGQVLAADTGMPLPNARLSVVPCDTTDGPFPQDHAVDARTDENGHFRIRPLPGAAFKLYACAPESDPYLELEQKITWRSAMVRRQLTLALPRGIPIRGRVVEADTGKSVEGARVDYAACPAGGPLVRNDEKPRLTGTARVWTDRDGRFFVPALPGQGWLRVNYRNGDRYLFQPPEESPQLPAAAAAALDVPANSTGEEVRIEVRRAGHLQGKAVDRNGTAVSSGLVLAAGPFGKFRDRFARRFGFRAGEFRVPNAYLDCTYPVVVLDAAHALAATTALSGKVEDALPLIELAPCGSAHGRLLHGDGALLEAAPLRLGAVLSFTAGRKQPEEVETNWYQVLGQPDAARTDDAGQFMLPALVPGVRYRLYATVAGSRRLVHEFTVASGQDLALPEKTVGNEQ